MGKAIIYKDRRIRQGEDPGTSDKKTVIFLCIYGKVKE